MPSYGDTERRLRARIGGLSLHLRHNSSEIARNARAGFDARFYEEALEIDPALEGAVLEGAVLEGAVLEQKVRILRSIYFSRLALKSLKTRAKKNQLSKGHG